MSAAIRMILGPALSRLRTNLAQGRVLLGEERNAANLEGIHHRRVLLTQGLERIDAETARWRDLMEDLEDDGPEVAIFEGFNQEGRHFLDWVEEAREVLAELQLAIGAAEGQPPVVPQQQPPVVPQQQPPVVVNGVGGGGNGGGGAAVQPPVRLPQLNLPTFGGDPLEWPNFWESFESAIDRHPLEAVDKLNYLMGCLTGKAAKSVVGYRGGGNYGNVVDTLKRLYGDNRVIAEALQAELINLPVCNDSVESLQAFVENLERSCRQLTALGQAVENPVLCQVVKNKIPKTALMEIIKAERVAGQQFGMEDLRRQLAEFVSIKAELQRFSTPSQREIPRKEKGDRAVEKGRVFVANAQLRGKSSEAQGKEANPGGCFLCEGKHRAYDCSNFKGPTERRRRLFNLKRCFKCLGKDHWASQCNKGRKCANCSSEDHHILICSEPIRKTNKPEGKSGKKKGKNGRRPFRAAVNAVTETKADHTMAVVSGMSDQQSESVILMARDVPFMNEEDPSKNTEAMTFFDPGATLNLIKSSLVERMGYKRFKPKKLDVSAFQSRDPIQLKAPRVIVVMKTKWGTPFRLPAYEVEWMVNSVHRADLNSGELTLANEEPEMLIGLWEFWNLFSQRERINSHLFRIHTALGNVICGKEEFPEWEEEEFQSIMTISSEMKAVDARQENELSKFWDLEMIGVKDDPTEKDDDIALDRFEESVKRLEDGRFSVGWPWKEFPPKLPTNYEMAYKRMCSNIRKMKDTPELLGKYHGIFQEQLEKGFIEPATRMGSGEHFLPHHVVINPKKIRMVFDAAAKLRGQLSLNETMFRGPVILPDLVGLLLRFRKSPYALWADLEKAFNSLALEPRDREYCKIVWVKDPNKPPEKPGNLAIYRWARVPFGVIASPFLLAACVRKFLKEAGSDLATEYMGNDYVDNLLALCETEEEAASKYKEGKALFKSCQMNLREFVCNSERVMATIPTEDRLNEKMPKVLGIYWDLEKDELLIRLPPMFVGKVITRRVVLKQLASIYDPLGILSPCLLPAKRFLQGLWQKPRGWDVPLEPNEGEEWTKILTTWKVSPFSFPRIGILSTKAKFQLHVFVDASEYAYAAAVYVRSEWAEETSARIFMAKSRLKAIGKEVTIPRMELMAMLIGTRLLKFASAQLQLSWEGRFLWGDNQSVLAWVASKEPQPRFVENRLREIREVGMDVRFLYVPTEQNPSDVASRGCEPESLKKHELWWEGPEWLKQEESQWPSIMEVRPTQVLEEEDEPETRVIGAVNLAVALDPMKGNDLIEISRFSHWVRLLSSLAFVFRWISLIFARMGKKPQATEVREISKKGSWTANDFALMERVLFRSAQKVWDKRELSGFKTIQDQNGIIRLASRLCNSKMKDEFINPILLPTKSQVTKLVIQFCHEGVRHMGVEFTLSRFLDRFWTPKSRLLAKMAVRQCQKCRRIRGKSFALPNMPHLPEDRVVRCAPFESVGIDYLGPTNTILRVQDGKRDVSKAWIVLITCLSTRAVYFEPVLDMTAGTFLHVLRRFASRRGTPRRILTDNGTSFVLASKVASALEAGRVPSTFLDHFLAREGIRWRFISHLSPWQGGVYERLVALIKTAFKCELGRKILNWDELLTFTTEVEAIVNQRPLTYTSVDGDGLEPLRPIDFIAPKAQLSIPVDLKLKEETGDPDFQISPPDNRQGLIAFWTGCAAALEGFWARWNREYLPMLREKAKWEHKGRRNQTTVQPRVGEVVLIEEDLVPRNQWHLGRIVELFGSVKAVRNARLRMGNGKFLIRPINRLVPLEVREEKTEDETPQAEIQSATKEPGRVKKVLTAMPSHGMVTRSKAKLALPILMQLIMVMGVVSNPLKPSPLPNVGIHPAVGSESIPGCRDCEVRCTLEGVQIRVPDRISKFEICCGAMRECISQKLVRSYIYRSAKEQLLLGFDCALSFWTKKGEAEIGRAECPAIEACELIECWVCIERLANPDCRPDLTLGLAGITGAAVLYGLCCLIGFFRSCCGNMAWICRLMCWPKAIWRWMSQEKRREGQEEVPLIEGSRSKPTVRKNRRISQMALLSKMAIMAFLGLAIPAGKGYRVDLEGSCSAFKSESHNQSMGTVWLCVVETREETVPIVAGRQLELYIGGVPVRTSTPSFPTASCPSGEYHPVCAWKWYIVGLIVSTWVLSFLLAVFFLEWDLAIPNIRNWIRRNVQVRRIFPCLFLLGLIRGIGGEAQVFSVVAKSENCWRTPTGSVCRLESVTTLTLLPAGQPVRLLLRNPQGKILGVLEIYMESISVGCIRHHERWLRSYRVDIKSRKDCFTVESCQNDFCSRMNKGMVSETIPELGEISQALPGFTRCEPSTAFWHNGCFLATSSCLFYRPYVVPLSEVVYELFTCPGTEHRIGAKLKLEMGGNTTKLVNTTLIPGITFRWENISVFPVGDSQPQIPALSGQFLTDGERVSLVQSLEEGLSCADFESARTLNCSFEQNQCRTCAFNHDEGTAHCQCREMALERLMEDEEKRLPLSIGQINLVNEGRDVLSVSSYTPIQVGIHLEGLHLVLEEDLNKCEGKAEGLRGCYGCMAGVGGAQLQFSCQTDFGSALAEAQCDDGTTFLVRCEEERKEQNISLHFDRAEVDTECILRCPGGQNKFRMQGHLNFIQEKRMEKWGGTQSRGYAPGNGTIPWPEWPNIDVGDIGRFFLNPTRMIILIVLVLGVVFLALCLIRLNPLLKGWRIVGRLAMAGLLLAGGSSATTGQQARLLTTHLIPKSILPIQFLPIQIPIQSKKFFPISTSISQNEMMNWWGKANNGCCLARRGRRGREAQCLNHEHRIGEGSEARGWMNWWGKANNDCCLAQRRGWRKEAQCLNHERQIGEGMEAKGWWGRMRKERSLMGRSNGTGLPERQFGTDSCRFVEWAPERRSEEMVGKEVAESFGFEEGRKAIKIHASTFLSFIFLNSLHSFLFPNPKTNSTIPYTMPIKIPLLSLAEAVSGLEGECFLDFIHAFQGKAWMRAMVDKIGQKAGRIGISYLPSHNFTLQGPLTLTKAAREAKAYGDTSVEDHYRQRRGISLRYPHLFCLVSMSQGQRNVFPPEVLVVYLDGRQHLFEILEELQGLAEKPTDVDGAYCWVEGHIVETEIPPLGPCTYRENAPGILGRGPSSSPGNLESVRVSLGSRPGTSGASSQGKQGGTQKSQKGKKREEAGPSNAPCGPSLLDEYELEMGRATLTFLRERGIESTIQVEGRVTIGRGMRGRNSQHIGFGASYPVYLAIIALFVFFAFTPSTAFIVPFSGITGKIENITQKFYLLKMAAENSQQQMEVDNNPLGCFAEAAAEAAAEEEVDVGVNNPNPVTGGTKDGNLPSAGSVLGKEKKRKFPATGENDGQKLPSKEKKKDGLGEDVQKYVDRAVRKAVAAAALKSTGTGVGVGQNSSVGGVVGPRSSVGGGGGGSSSSGTSKNTPNNSNGRPNVGGGGRNLVGNVGGCNQLGRKRSNDEMKEMKRELEELKNLFVPSSPLKSPHPVSLRNRYSQAKRPKFGAGFAPQNGGGSARWPLVKAIHYLEEALGRARRDGQVDGAEFVGEKILQLRAAAERYFPDPLSAAGVSNPST